MVNRKTFWSFVLVILFFSLFFSQFAKAGDEFVFNRNLQRGSANQDVKELQKFLNNNGFVIDTSGIGSPGKESFYFGSLTQKALIKFQKANKITPAIGYFGPITRKIVNKKVSDFGSNTSQVTDIISNNNNSSIVNSVNNHTSHEQYSISGSITGCVGPVILQNNGGDDITINIGDSSNFTFLTKLNNGAKYNVTNKSKNSDQICYSVNNIGTVDGKNITNIKIACGLNLVSNPFTYIPSSGGQTRITTYSLNYTAGENGSISGVTPQIVNSGSNGSSVLAVANTGYHFTTWSDNLLTAERTDTNVVANKTVSASFATDTFEIISTAGTNGTISPEGENDYNYGSNQEFTITPDTNYHINDVLVDSVSVGVTTSYTFTNITATHTISASFSQDVATAPSSIHLTTSTLNSVGRVTDVAIPDSGATDITGAVIGWVSSTNSNIKFSVTDSGSASSTISINGSNYSSGENFTIISTNSIAIIVTTTEIGKITSTRRFTITVTSLAVGDSYQGGKVAYILQSGDPGYVAGKTYGLIASSADNSDAGVAWITGGSTTTTLNSSTSNNIGTGQMNTLAMMGQTGYTGGAAQLCNDYSVTVAGITYSDWYLPSKNELNKFNINKTAIGGFIYTSYWSSSENDGTSAWAHAFTDSNIQFSNPKSSSNLLVRCARSIGTEITAISEITGTSQVGATLTAGTLSPAGATVSYQWKISSTTNGVYTNITGATSSTYVPVASDVGKYIKVVAVGTGDYTSVITSEATTAITAVLSIGDSYGGGKVAYILQPADVGYVTGTQHGLIAAIEDQSSGIIWAIAAYQSTAVPSGTLATIGSGSANTDNIIAQNGAGITYAAGKARSYAGGGYNDWYLPSRYELLELDNNRVAIGGFASSYYWSSTENGANVVWSKSFPASSWSSQLKSTQWTRVRAVRSF